MKNLKYLTVIAFFAFVLQTTAQVRIVNSTTNSSVLNGSTFIDAGSNPTINGSTNVGKGLVYPRTNLTDFTSFSGGPIGSASSYPTRFDGMMVYNTATSGVAGVGATQGTLTEGFWYYDNKTTDVNGGTWRPVGGAAAQVKEAVVTYVVPAANASANIDLDGTAGTLVPGSNPLPGASNVFLSATVYGANNAIIFSNAAYNVDTRVLTTGNGFINQVLAPGTYRVVVAYR